MTIEKQDTIAATMRKFMASGPSTVDYPSYKALNDFVGSLHGLPAGKCQTLAGEKAWAWTPDPVTKTWRKATPEEVTECREKAAKKNNGARRAKVMSTEDRLALDAQITALEAVNNPALTPLLEDLRAKRAADDIARKGSLKDRLAVAITKMGLEKVVDLLEEQVATETATETA